MANSGQNYINHIVLLLDASASMDTHRDRLIEVADEQISYLAKRSQELDQETRITVYTFANTPECVVYDKDVLRLPSIARYYRPGGMTALIDATDLALDDLAMTPEKYGDHSFLVFVLTDGYENASKGRGRYTEGNTHRNPLVAPTLGPDRLGADLAKRIDNLPDHWSVAVFVPDERGASYARQYGFPADNVALWNASSARGVEEAVSVMRTATDNYMTNRALGVRGSKTLFVGSTVDAKAVKQQLTPMDPTTYKIVPVTKLKDAAFEKALKKPTRSVPEPPKGWFVRIDDFINHIHPPFRIGKGFYQLFSGESRRSERVQGNKQIVIMEKSSSKVYSGSAARQIIGLGDETVTIKAGSHPAFEIFVESTSDNRHLPVGTKLLVLTK